MMMMTTTASSAGEGWLLGDMLCKGQLRQGQKLQQRSPQWHRLRVALLGKQA
jgi:hypothetical protein